MFKKILLRIVLVFSCFLPLVSSGGSVPDAADAAYRQALQILRNPKSGDIPLYAVDCCPDAAQLLRSAADRGHRWATIRLGSLYLCGKGVDRSLSRAFSCYLRAGRLFLTNTVYVPAACIILLFGVTWIGFRLRSFCSAFKSRLLMLRAGSSCAVLQYKLGMRYVHGKGTARRLTDARRLFEESAEKNYAPAQVEIGRFFKDGIIVHANRLKAAEWFQKAASQGHAEGLFLVGRCYERGEGVPLNLSRALGFYRMGASCRHADAEVSAELCERKMTGRQKEDAREFAREYAEQNGFVWFKG